MTWDGDISKMGRLAANIGRLARVPSQAAPRVAREIATLIEEEFEAGADPYGRAWEPLAQSTRDRGRTEPPLTDTFTMRGAVEVRPMPHAGVSIHIPHPAEDHQTGWVGPISSGPARPVLPGLAFPRRWSEAIKAAVDDEVRMAVGQ